MKAELKKNTKVELESTLNKLINILTVHHCLLRRQPNTTKNLHAVALWEILINRFYSHFILKSSKAFFLILFLK